MRRFVFCSLLSCLFFSFVTSVAWSQDKEADAPEVQSKAVIVHTKQKLVVGNKVAGEALAGDMLTVLSEAKGFYWVETGDKKRGWILKTSVVDLPKASSVFDKLIKESPENAGLYAGRALVWEAQNNAEKAIEDYSTAIEKGYEEPHAFVSRGMFYAAMGKYDEAIKDYGEAMKLGLNDEYVMSNRAGAYMAKQDYANAMKDYDAVVKLKPKDTGAYYQRGMAWKAQNEPDKAIADFNKVLKIQADHIPALSSRGYMYFLKGEPKKAVEDFSAVIKINPKAALAFNNRGFNYQQLGEYKKALADYDESTKLAPTYALAHQNKGWLLATCPDEKVRDGKEALISSERACELTDWKNPFDIKAVAASYAEQKKFAEAVKWQTKVVELVSTKEAKDAEKTILELYKKKKPYRFERPKKS